MLPKIFNIPVEARIKNSPAFLRWSPFSLSSQAAAEAPIILSPFQAVKQQQQEEDESIHGSSSCTTSATDNISTHCEGQQQAETVDEPDHQHSPKTFEALSPQDSINHSSAFDISETNLSSKTTHDFCDNKVLTSGKIDCSALVSRYQAVSPWRNAGKFFNVLSEKIPRNTNSFWKYHVPWSFMAS